MVIFLGWTQVINRLLGYYVMEAGVGIEPTNSGFAVRGITTLLPGLNLEALKVQRVDF